jgi:hypothetical protein
MKENLVELTLGQEKNEIKGSFVKHCFFCTSILSIRSQVIILFLLFLQKSDFDSQKNIIPVVYKKIEP